MTRRAWSVPGKPLAICALSFLLSLAGSGWAQQPSGIQEYPVPSGSRPHDVAPAPDGSVWYTAQGSGELGRLDPRTGATRHIKLGDGSAPHGVIVGPASGAATVIEPPTSGQGARRVWPDSRGRIWVSEWNVGQLGMYDPGTGRWREWRLPGDQPRAYAVDVDHRDMVWVTDFGANPLVRFDPSREMFDVFRLPSPQSNVRQLLGRPGEVWGAASAVDKLVVVRTP